MSASPSENRLLRSWLFVPGTRLDLLSKAKDAKADAIIVDLEDAVLPEHKAPARSAVAQLRPFGYPLFMRVNSVETSDFDLDVAAALQAGVAGIMLPKVERPEDIDALRARTPKTVRIVALIETARGVSNLSELAHHPDVHRLAFGSVDFALDVGCTPYALTMDIARAQMVLASRTAGLPPPIDGVTVSMDPQTLERDTTDSKALGFGGKLCIHPRQIECVNRAFRPSDNDIAWARRVVARATEAGSGALLVDGEMVDRPVLERAKRILAEL
jgi:citrate lyase subunit beta / citryl-CoA lyase